MLSVLKISLGAVFQNNNFTNPKLVNSLPFKTMLNQKKKILILEAFAGLTNVSLREGQWAFMPFNYKSVIGLLSQLAEEDS